MTNYINGFLAGMGDSVTDKEYQQTLNAQAAEILGDKTSISAKNLKKTPLFSEAYKKLDAEGQKRFDSLLNLDGDSKNVSEKELKTLLTLLDADLTTGANNEEVFLMDNKVSTGKTGGIYQATDKEIQYVYDNTKTRAEQQAEEVAKLKAAAEKQKANAEKLENVNNEINKMDTSTGSGLTKALNYIGENISWGSSEGLKMYDSAINNLFKDQLEDVGTYRDGGSRIYTLKDGTTIFHDNKLFGAENGFVTITRPDGSVEKYNPQGEKVE